MPDVSVNKQAVAARDKSDGAGCALSHSGLHTAIYVRLQHAESLLVTLKSQVQGVQHPLGGKEVGDDPLRNGDRLRRRSSAQ